MLDWLHNNNHLHTLTLFLHYMLCYYYLLLFHNYMLSSEYYVSNKKDFLPPLSMYRLLSNYSMCSLYYLYNFDLNLLYLILTHSRHYCLYYYSNHIYLLLLNFLYNNLNYYLYMYLNDMIHLFPVNYYLHNRILLILLDYQKLLLFYTYFHSDRLRHHFQNTHNYLDLPQHIYMSYLLHYSLNYLYDNIFHLNPDSYIILLYNLPVILHYLFEY